MPVTTRAQSRRIQAVESQLTRKPSKTGRQLSKSTNAAALKQSPAPRASQPSSQEKPRPILTKPLLPVLPSTIEKYFWPCQNCSCQDGVFEGLVDNCVTCEHTMDDHGPHPKDPWTPPCEYLCKREKLVTEVLEHTRKWGVMVIRATPMVGKTSLLQLLGHHIAHNERDLEPVFVYWEKREKRNGLRWETFLKKNEAEWQEMNTQIRPCNPQAQTIYLIDEAQGSYEEEGFWSMLKSYRSTRSQSLFILVCVYGAVGVSYKRDPNIESQAQRMHALQRLELRPSTSFRLCMLFRQEEVDLIAKKFAIYNGYQLGQGVAKYLYSATDGHPGMVSLLLSHISGLTKSNMIRMPQILTPEFFHNLLVQREDSFVEWLSKWGRGVWSPYCEANVKVALQAPMYSHLKLLDIKKALCEVAMQTNGLTRSRKDFDAFAFCHKWGLLHTEQPESTSEETTFTFASPLHRRVAYRRLFPGLEPDAVMEYLSLQQICTNAIARFSPAVLQKRQNSKSNKNWGIPEAAFQDELYCCLSLELHYLPILSEYSHIKDGQIDFYVSSRRWGVEILQCGSTAVLAEHISRFATDGIYQKWDIMDDYIILNFCPRSALPTIHIEDKEIQSRVFHVVIEPDKQNAEIYTYDKQLHKSWSLSEGRQRKNSDNFSDFVEWLDDSERMPSQNEPTEKERAMMEELKEMKEREREHKKEMEELRLQMEQMREDKRLQTVRDENHEETAEVQDKSAERSGKKRKR